MSDSIFLGPNVASLETGEVSERISRVNLSVDSDNYFTAGDDSGKTLELECPWASQAMADSILAKVKNYDYQPLEADNALLDPAAEIGDAVTVGGYRSVLAQINTTFNNACAATISAPGSDEVDDEYPYKSHERREMERELARTRSLISKSSEEILLQVEGIAEDLEGQISSISVKLDSITLSVSNGSTSSTIELKAGETTISSETIQMDGLVTFTGLSSGTTTINGACIKTGQIDADRLNLTGAITFSDLSSSVQGDINDAQSTANSAYSLANAANNTANNAKDKVEAWSYRGTTYIDGSKIQTGTVEASILRGGTVELLASGGSTVGSIEITSTTTGVGLEFVTNRGGMRMTSAGNWWVDTTNCSFGTTSTGRFSFSDSPTPSSDGSVTLGRSTVRWGDVYSQNATINTSDANFKKDVEYGLDRFLPVFDALRPVSFKFIDGQSDRTHMGIIAQDLEETLSELNIPTKDFAAFIKSWGIDEETKESGYRYAIRYGEFIPLLIYQVQKIKEALKDKGVIS